MTGYLIRRILQAIITCLIVTIITFLLMHAVPNGLVNELVGSKNLNNPGRQAAGDQRAGLNKPIIEQYFVWLNDLIHGRFGFDYYYEQSVGSLLTERLGQSVFIVGLALLITILLAVPIGVVQALKRNTWIDHTLTTFSFVAYSIPTFLIGWLLLYYFVDVTGWIPTGNQISSFHDAWSQPIQLLLPVGTLVITSLASYTRYMRSAMLDQITQDYVRTADRQGREPQPGDLRARAAQRADPDGHPRRTLAARPGERRADHRVRLQHQRHRPADHAGRAEQRPGHHARHHSAAGNLHRDRFAACGYQLRRS
jgi:peptide/nickel transport system permease protein